MKYLQKSLKDAFQLVKEKRSIIKPNYSFSNQLIKFEEKLYGKNSITIDQLYQK